MAVHQLVNALHTSGRAMHHSLASRGASRLDTDGAAPPQLDLTAPHQFGVGYLVWKVGSLTAADLVTGASVLVVRDRR